MSGMKDVLGPTPEEGVLIDALDVLVKEVAEARERLDELLGSPVDTPMAGFRLGQGLAKISQCLGDAVGEAVARRNGAGADIGLRQPGDLMARIKKE